MQRRFWSTALGAAAVALVAVLTQPGVALAATTLVDGQWVIATGTQPASTDYMATTSRPYWSVVLLSPGRIYTNAPNTVVDYKVQAFDSAGTQLAATTFPLTSLTTWRSMATSAVRSRTPPG